MYKMSKKIHGMKGTRFLEIWRNMRKRCYNSNRDDFKNYGARGIKICDRWHDFCNFRDDMYAEYLEHSKKHTEKNTTIDRIDVNGDYEPSNCRWATQQEQQKNKRPFKERNYDLSKLSKAGKASAEKRAIYYEFNGEKLTLDKISERTGINYHTLRYRIYKSGLTLEEALSPRDRRRDKKC